MTKILSVSKHSWYQIMIDHSQCNPRPANNVITKPCRKYPEWQINRLQEIIIYLSQTSIQQEI